RSTANTRENLSQRASTRTEHPPMGEFFVKRAWEIGPVTCCAVGLAGTVLLAFLAGAVFGAVAWSGVKLERPQRSRPSGRGRGRTSLRPASGGRGSGARKSLGLWVWVARGARVRR